jgi:hypothetical protein
MAVLANSDIIALFTNIAETHPSIEHNPAATPPVNRFYTFDEDQFLNDSAKKIDLGACILGLSISGRNLSTWNYKDVGTAQQKLKYINVVCLAKYETGNFADEDAKAQTCEQVLDDVASWIWQQAAMANCNWQVVELMDPANISAKRLKGVGIGTFCGAVMTVTLRAYITYSNTNPLNSMTP